MKEKLNILHVNFIYLVLIKNWLSPHFCFCALVLVSGWPQCQWTAGGPPCLGRELHPAQGAWQPVFLPAHHKAQWWGGNWSLNFSLRASCACGPVFPLNYYGLLWWGGQGTFKKNGTCGWGHYYSVELHLFSFSSVWYTWLVSCFHLSILLPFLGFSHSLLGLLSAWFCSLE